MFAGAATPHHYYRAVIDVILCSLLGRTQILLNLLQRLIILLLLILLKDFVNRPNFGLNTK